MSNKNHYNHGLKNHPSEAFMCFTLSNCYFICISYEFLFNSAYINKPLHRVSKIKFVYTRILNHTCHLFQKLWRNPVVKKHKKSRILYTHKCSSEFFEKISYFLQRTGKNTVTIMHFSSPQWRKNSPFQRSFSKETGILQVSS